MATLLVPETHATINAAIAAAANGDTISIGAGTYTETILSQSGVTAYPLHFEGRTGNWADVIITSPTPAGSGHGVVSIASGGSISNCSIIFTAAPGGSDYAFTYGSAGGGCQMTNCKVDTSYGGVRAYAAGLTVLASMVESTVKNAVYATWGVRSTVSTAPNLYSSAFIDFNHAQIYMYGGGDVVNCTVQTDYRKNTSLRGIYCNNSYNNIYHNNSGLTGFNGTQGNTANVNCISYGETTDFGGAAAVASFDSSTVVTPVFIDEAANNFEVDPAGSAYKNGSYTYQTANGAPLVAIGNRTIPAVDSYIGAFQATGGGGSGPSGKSVTRLSNLNNLNNMKL